MIAALIMSACDRTKEDKVTEAFKEYVKTDFSDPDDFIEITKIDNTDTLNVERALELSTTLDSIKHLFPDNIREKYEYRRKKLIEDDPCVIVHPIKVRTRGEGESKVIREYWVIEDKGQARGTRPRAANGRDSRYLPRFSRNCGGYVYIVHQGVRIGRLIFYEKSRPQNL